MTPTMLNRLSALLSWLTERRRAYIYRILTGLGAVALLYGWLTEDQLAVWLSLAAQTLGVAGNGLASANTSTKKE